MKKSRVRIWGIGSKTQILKDRMMATKIPYVDEVWNLAVGCTKIAPGCLHCWGEDWHTKRHLAKRAGRKLPQQYARPFSEVQFLPERLEQPLHWRRPRDIFVCSQSDLFHVDISDEQIWRVLHTMAVALQHRYFIFTKRIERAHELLNQFYRGIVKHKWSYNIWLMLSISTQNEADEKIPILMDTNVVHRGLSIEPDLEEIDVSYKGLGIICPECKGKGYITNRKHWMHPANTGDGSAENWCLDCNNLSGFNPIIAGIEWVICGCESGSKRRPFDPDWARAILRQCERPEVPFWMKQMEIQGRVRHAVKYFPEDLQIQEKP